MTPNPFIQAAVALPIVLIISSLILDLPPYLYRKFKEARKRAREATVAAPERKRILKPQAITLSVNIFR